MNIPHDFYKLASILAAACFFIPVILVTVRNLFRNKLLLWFAVYWFWAGLINVLCSTEIIGNTLALNIVERIYNLLDIPIILFIIYRTTDIESIRKSLKKILIPLLTLEVVILTATGFSNEMETALVFCGVLLVLFYISWTIISYARKTSFKDYSISYQCIYYGLLFEYTISIIIVIYSYMIPHRSNNDDNFLIFHLSTIITIATASAGILAYKEEKPGLKVKKQKQHQETEIRYL